MAVNDLRQGCAQRKGRVRPFVLRVARDILDVTRIVDLSDAAFVALFRGWARHGDTRSVPRAEMAEDVATELLARGLAEDHGSALHLVPVEEVRGYPLLSTTRRGWSRAAYPDVLARDGSTCRYCGNATARPTIDHVVPRCQGGGDEPANLAVACWACNIRKRGRTPEQAGMRLRPVREVS